ncbi:MAG: hypothetical protein A3C27_03530 [Candidatus Levybacteria bacterium RIFCSPHIGHO2_02_FULL_39_36]|nr:MAG: Glycosyl transferase [Candidatus Levybacteria bacterium GW2011_GWA1_39_11]KKR25025.1 MAG: Glycosyl transferase [Candidatus Levybacteria bacterium GW2011_GWB1_39_7]OGH14698.1 MAG: hypothetical protein A2689_00710 [Candidatus Levybacteria bacterium RIFCSPHIGHO2_01_FULL_38_96]OGH28280.1 MAG: hypothetical protein A3C27_03530 [Candidatus Levybacteria bacterium RIFCSPHIGHO2_02_FULL_39_36]OGH36065.1 MAG: hypothetical protein A3B43_02840 [Candidatus Levybacteria bacterium RIFCSPLOWO2_01_FULL_38
MNQLPKITIIIVTLNNERTIGECVRTIMTQDYPKHLIEYINVDGGSTDATKTILKKNKFRIIDSPIKKNAEAQRAIGLKHAKNNLIVSLDADNYLPHKKWITQMVRPFLENKDIVHAGTLHFTHKKNDPALNRYVALFGVVDPTVYYIGRPDRVPWFKNKWSGGDILRETPEYYIVRFNRDSLPTVGCNGVVYRRDILLKNAQSDPSRFIHIDVFADLFEKGHDKYAVVKNDVIHDTAINLTTLMKKRIAFLYAYYYLNSNKNVLKRRYLIYNPKKPQDVFRLFVFIFYTITFVKPLIDSIRGYFIVRDVAWFLHPIMCWVYLYAYSLATIKKFLGDR